MPYKARFERIPTKDSGHPRLGLGYDWLLYGVFVNLDWEKSPKVTKRIKAQNPKTGNILKTNESIEQK